MSIITIIRNIIISLLILSNFALSAKVLTSDELILKYPTIGEVTSRAENKEILCPFWRLIERSGALDMYNALKRSDLVIANANLIKKAVEFGCSKLKCGAVVSLVSAGQLTHFGVTYPFRTNISKLEKARGVAHDCGLTFKKGSGVVSDDHRSNTLKKLEEISLSNSPTGILSKEDLMKVKLDICKSQGVSISGAGKIEVGLIYSYLGGDDRGFIEYEDVSRFLNTQMPLTKSIDKI